MNFQERSDVAKMAAELYEVTLARRDVEKREARLKGALRKMFPEGTILRTGLHVLSVTPGERETLDREALAQDLGPELLAPYVKKSPYLTVSVTSEVAARGGVAFVPGSSASH